MTETPEMGCFLKRCTRGKSYYVAHRGGLKVRPHQRQRKAVIDAKVGGNRKSRQAEGACR
jgi:hypothetical protein